MGIQHHKIEIDLTIPDKYALIIQALIRSIKTFQAYLERIKKGKAF